MEHYTPTSFSGETGHGVREFVRDNKAEFWNIFRPYLPFIVGFYFLDALINELYFKDGNYVFEWGSFVALSFLYTCVAISWHRVVIKGPDNYESVNPFKPKFNELMFIAAAVLIMVIPSVLLFGFIFITAGSMDSAALENTEGAVFIGLLLLLIALVYCGIRVLFYFPAKAVDADITLKNAFVLSKGYVWKVFWASLLVTFRLVLLSILVDMIMMIAVASAGFIEVDLQTIMSDDVEKLPPFVNFLIEMPYALYFGPLMTVLTVTVLSNYYLHAIQNLKGE